MNQWLSEPASAIENIRAIIVPHSGYDYSGDVAACAFRYIKYSPKVYRNIILLGASHHFHFDGIVLSGAKEFSTPVGEVPIDTDATGALSLHPEAHFADAVHAPEHSLELQLPFLHACLPDARIIPILVGEIQVHRLAQIIEPLWGSDTLMVVCSDLSESLRYQEAIGFDQQTKQMIETKTPELDEKRALGFTAINAFLEMIKDDSFKIEELKYSNSGELTEHRSRVVGYSSFVIYQSGN
ncbi:AmmeMemoRadiSam system protein B [Vibrio sp. SCSIO 43136]|uniref:AmmeMemoRadiSam system protein B n=1 Tax=Vibrio sp. SCSIO 43136 TaxID=2819101 RepID=UPI0020759A18|nr:AmmeMemoRadiSam system protein B [Vibrio sp. SCSIO 43136]